MPHSSAGFGEVNIDRIYLIESETAKETNEAKLTLEGQEASPPATFALVSYLHSQINALEIGKLMPVTFRDKAERDGYYVLGAAASDLIDYQSEVAVANWTMDLTRVGHHTEVDLQSRVTGAVRQNDFALTGTRWHAPAIGHYAYTTGSTDPTTVMTRTGADGAMTVYVTIPANVHPKWGCTPGNYKGGRVRITDTSEVTSENELEGVNRNIGTLTWALTNGLVNVTPTSSAGIIDVQYHNGTSYVANQWKVTTGGNALPAWSSATILRNDFEMCVLRLTAPKSPGRYQLDLSLRRGSRFVEGYLQSSSSVTLGVIPNVTPSGFTNNAATGHVVEAAGTHRRVGGSARTFTGATTGAMSKSSAVTFDFWLGAVINGASPATGDSATNLRDQYIGTMPEYTYAVRR